MRFDAHFYEFRAEFLRGARSQHTPTGQVKTKQNSGGKRYDHFRKNPIEKSAGLHIKHLFVFGLRLKTWTSCRPGQKRFELRDKMSAQNSTNRAAKSRFVSLLLVSLNSQWDLKRAISLDRQAKVRISVVSTCSKKCPHRKSAASAPLILRGFVLTIELSPFVTVCT